MMKYVSPFERLSVGILILIGLGLFFVSLMSLYNDFYNNRPLVYLAFDVIILGLSVIIIGGALRIYKRILILSAMTDYAFNNIVYERLKPILETIAVSSIKLDEMREEVKRLRTKIDTTERGIAPSLTLARSETSIRLIAFYIKSMIVVLVFFGMYLFFVNYDIRYEAYLYTLMYVLWWVFITNEFRIFTRLESWISLGIPILLVPTGAIIIRTLFGLVTLNAILLGSTLVYGYLYYRYARHLSEEALMPTDGYRGGNFLIESLKSTLIRMYHGFRKL
jgi:hypothetical protein